MTKLLTKVMRMVDELPRDRQDDVAQMLLTVIENDNQRVTLDEDQLQEVGLAMAEADAGKFACDVEIERALHRPWA